jgi:hypothetical protein
MQAKNIGNHNHGSRGYYRKRPKWRKEDALTKQAGKTIPWDEYKDQQTREFIKSRYHVDPKTGDLVTDKKTEDVTKELIVNLLA